jgi:two-component system chemotaxis response regulator CheB
VTRFDHVREFPRVRVLIVDDSALMRKLLTDLLKSAPEIEVVGTARDGGEAVAQASALKPDVITLDVEMPGLSGLEALPLLQAVHNAAIIMVSTFTQEGADVTLAALEAGAIDFLPKPDRHQITQLRESRDTLVSKILAAAQTRTRGSRSQPSSPTLHDSTRLSRTIRPRPEPAAGTSRASDTDLDVSSASNLASRCIVIGISTGGPQALGQVLPLVSGSIPPILVVQHMPGQFTFVFAERLNRSCEVAVKEAEDGDRVVANRILIAPGGRHLTVIGHAPNVRVAITDGPPVSGHRPSVDVLFRSAARAFPNAVVGIMMTGMGRDGVEGCRAILDAGGSTFGQDEASSVVYGMNKAAYLEGVIGSQFALDQFPALIKRLSASGVR